MLIDYMNFWSWSTQPVCGQTDGKVPAVSSTGKGKEHTLKLKRFRFKQLFTELQHAELRIPGADLITDLGIAEQTLYRWKRQCARQESEQVRRFKQLQDENAKLKSLVAELFLDKLILQEVLAKNDAALATATIRLIHSGIDGGQSGQELKPTHWRFQILNEIQRRGHSFTTTCGMYVTGLDSVSKQHNSPRTLQSKEDEEVPAATLHQWTTHLVNGCYLHPALGGEGS